MPRPKTLEAFTFDELVDEATQHAHSALLETGGKGLRGSIFLWLQAGIRWSEAQVKAEEKAKEIAKRKKKAGTELKKLLR